MINFNNNNHEIKGTIGYSVTKTDVISNDEIIIKKETDTNYSSIGTITVWQLIEEGINDKINDICKYNNLKNENFIYKNFININDSFMQLKTNYSKPVEVKEKIEDLYVCSITINLDDYREFEVI